MNPLEKKLRPYVAQIEEDAAKGDPMARRIITLYSMCVRAPNDHAAQALCQASFDDWRRTKGHTLRRTEP